MCNWPGNSRGWAGRWLCSEWVQTVVPDGGESTWEAVLECREKKGLEVEKKRGRGDYLGIQVCFNPLMHVALKNNLRTLVKSFGMQHISEFICIRNTRCSGPNLQVSFKYFVNLYLILKSLKSDKLEILHAKEQLENILIRNVNKNPTKNSPLSFSFSKLLSNVS